MLVVGQWLECLATTSWGIEWAHCSTANTLIFSVMSFIVVNSTNFAVSLLPTHSNSHNNLVKFASFVFLRYTVIQCIVTRHFVFHFFEWFLSIYLKGYVMLISATVMFAWIWLFSLYKHIVTCCFCVFIDAFLCIFGFVFGYWRVNSNNDWDELCSFYMEMIMLYRRSASSSWTVSRLKWWKDQ